jgi:hypothetical protein
MRNLFSVVFAVSGLVVLLAAGACSTSSSSTPAQCNTQPFACGAGTTCWEINVANDFGCITSGGGKSGDTCLNTQGAATCGDGLLCLQLPTQAAGHCVPWCDTQHVCPTSQTCTPAAIQGTTQVVHVCFGGAPPADAGPGTDASDAEPPADAASE